MGGRGPHRIKISPYDPERHVWVIDDSGHQVFKFTHDGKSLVMRLGEAGVRGTDEKHLGGPTDIAWLPDGTFFVSDGYRNSRVVKFDEDGKYLTSWGTKGTEPGQFDLPHAIDVDRNRRVYVADAHNGRVQVFDENGKFLDLWPNVWRPDVLMVTADQTSVDRDRRDQHDAEVQPHRKAPRGLGQAWRRSRRAFKDVHGFGVDAAGTFYAAEAAGSRTQKFTPKAGADQSKLVGPQQPLAPLKAR